MCDNHFMWRSRSHLSGTKKSACSRNGLMRLRQFLGAFMDRRSRHVLNPKRALAFDSGGVQISGMPDTQVTTSTLSRCSDFIQAFRVCLAFLLSMNRDAAYLLVAISFLQMRPVTLSAIAPP